MAEWAGWVGGEDGAELEGEQAVGGEIHQGKQPICGDIMFIF